MVCGGLHWARGSPQTFVGWGGGLGIRLDSKGSSPGEKAAGQGAESAVLLGAVHPEWVHSGLGAEAAARVCSLPLGGGEPGA